VRLELLWNWRLLCERIAVASLEQRRLGKLRNTPADKLSIGHIDSLELLEMAQCAGIKAIYDVGANVGTWVLLAKAIIPEATVHAFEPLPIHHDSFARNCRSLLNVNLHRIALGSQNTSASLRVTDFSDASSFLPLATAGRKIFGLAEVSQVLTTVRRLDDFRAENKLALPDLIKLDVQGFELEVVSGAISVLANVKALILEVSFVEIYQDQCMFPEISNFLDRHNFTLHALGVSTPLGKPLIQADALFIKKP